MAEITIETPTSRLEACSVSEKPSGNPAFGEPADTEIDTTDPNLVKVIDAWPMLPEPIRRAMLALTG